MKHQPAKTIFLTIGFISLLFLIQSCGPKWTEEIKGDFNIVTNKGGQILGYSPKSGISLITKNGFAFKDLNKNGDLDIYEDWRKPVDERAKDRWSQPVWSNNVQRKTF
ncbi:MAG: hypothetical protein FD181_2141 [Prolixibacteraceae bacterium]|nr:MAG: hypothetical protein FD181_2141 [Prolixibacteraceae bacterium]